ncbi:hypothetical protein KL86PLE_130610 [uncultured Pleomorphomonas sp.]|uniref:Uncharacterized protein n=1 Tax=uncultured Pleomorphomonas sp. TaxID=442121 RepID=A0A212LCY0_9HYPH|nr:hypothetical protein KL86PLE_130610 [uncultured Pleomorphomonas sp.]
MGEAVRPCAGGGGDSGLGHRTEKWELVFGKSDALTKGWIVTLRPSGRMAI